MEFSVKKIDPLQELSLTQGEPDKVHDERESMIHSS